MNTLKSLLWMTCLIILVWACDTEDKIVTPISLNFTNTELGISSSTTSVDVNITFSRATVEAGTIDLSLVTDGLTYGSDADYYTEPDMAEGVIHLAYQVGDESVTFTIHAGTGLNIEEDKKAVVTMMQSVESAVLGENKSATITFSENFIAAGGIIELNGGGTTFPNQAYVDLSKLKQTTVDKYTWDLGFSSQLGEHHVILNASGFVMARPLDKSNIDDVSAADTVGFSAKMIVSNYVDAEASEWIDDQSGDLTKTVFGEISATDSEAKVFIIKRDGEGRRWKKVRVLKEGEKYVLQYADIASATHTSVEITKAEAYNFSFFDLDNGAVTVEPEKDSWDIMYGTYTGKANYGQILAIGYNDYIITNREISVAKIATEGLSYDDFQSSDLSTITLVSNDISVIGSTWRKLVDFTLVLSPNVFYVIKDGDGNYYKFKSNRLKSVAGERGYPEFSFELLK